MSERSDEVTEATARHRKPSPFDALLAEVAAAPSPPIAPWELIEQDRFRVYELLGKGGGGQVYRAFDTQLNRHVALKFLNVGGAERTEALVKEARTQAQVQHANVCQVYEVIETIGQPFLVMQLIEGPTLSAAAASLTDHGKAEVIRQVAEAIAAAHALGIVHRDIKPNNILLQRSKDGGELRPFITDFGLARELDTTFTHGVVGTPHFMSPEQARGNSADVGISTDVWALGATLFTLLEGRPPFVGDSMMSILDNVLRASPAPLPADVPRDLATIVLRCLEKDPARRFATAQELADELGRFVRGEPIRTQAPSRLRRWWQRRPRRREVEVGIGALVVALGVAAFALSLRRGPSWRPEVKERQPVFEENADGVVISPDGTQQVYASNRDGTWRIYLESVKEPASRPAPGERSRPLAAQASLPWWAPDGKSIYFTDHSGDRSTIRRLALTPGASPELVVEASEAVACGERLFYRVAPGPGCVRCARIMLREPAAGPDRELLRAGPQELSELACEHSGRLLAYTRLLDEQHWRVAWMDVDTRVEHVLPSPGAASSEPVLHPDGRSLVSRVRRGYRHTIWEQSLDGRVQRELTTGVHDMAPSFSPDGKRLFYNVDLPGRAITVHPLDGGVVRRLQVGNWTAIDITPDGEDLLLTSKGEHIEISLLSVRDGAVRPLAHGVVPSASPDNQTIFYVAADDRELVMAVPRFGGAARVVGRAPRRIRDLFAATDGVHLELADGAQQAFWMAADGSQSGYEADPLTSMVMIDRAGWRIARGVDGERRIVPPGPWPATGILGQPASGLTSSIRLSGDRRGVLDTADGFLVYHELATGRAHRLLESPPEEEGAVVLGEKGPVYTLEDRTVTRRMELVNYGALPRL